MDIKLFSLCNEESPIADKGKQYILDCVKNFTDECDGFAHFTSQKRMLVSVSQSLLSAEVIIIAVQGTMYNATKKLLCQALDVKSEENLLVMEQLTPMLNAGKIKPSAYKSNVLFPPFSEILPTKDYINCGFAISSGNQHIIYMPVDSTKADDVVFGSLYDYLAEICDDDTALCFEHRTESIILRTAKRLVEKSISVAIADYNIGHIISPIFEKNNISSLSIVQNLNDYSQPDQKEFVTVASRAVRNNSDFGAAVSSVVTDEENNRFAFVAVADEQNTKLLKIYAENNESDDELIRICVDRMMLLLYNYSEADNETEESASDIKKDEKLRAVIGITVAGLTLAASVTGFILALILK